MALGRCGLVAGPAGFLLVAGPAGAQIRTTEFPVGPEPARVMGRRPCFLMATAAIILLVTGPARGGAVGREILVGLNPVCRMGSRFGLTVAAIAKVLLVAGPASLPIPCPFDAMGPLYPQHIVGLGFFRLVAFPAALLGVAEVA